MRRARSTAAHRRPASVAHARRRCLCCGYQGDELQRPVERRPSWCPHCADDLYARPPRSYAEMEGVPIAPPVRPFGSTLARLFERSVALGLGVVVCAGLLAGVIG